MPDKSKAYPPHAVPRKPAGDKYDSPRWRRFRQTLLGIRIADAKARQQSICEDCAAEGVGFDPAGVWHADHVVPCNENSQLFWRSSNIEFRCTSHHSQREQDGRYGENAIVRS